MMKVKDLLEQEVCVDVVDDVTEELYIAFDGPQKLTKEGKKKFAEALEFEVSMGYEPSLWIIHVDDPDDEVWERRLRIAKELFEGMAGYCSVEEYERWFEEADDDDETDDEDPDAAIKSVAHELLMERFPSYWGAFDSDFYDAVTENVKETSDWPHWNDDDVSLAVQRAIIWNMKRGVTEA